MKFQYLSDAVKILKGHGFQIELCQNLKKDRAEIEFTVYRNFRKFRIEFSSQTPDPLTGIKRRYFRVMTNAGRKDIYHGILRGPLDFDAVMEKCKVLIIKINMGLPEWDCIKPE